MNKKLESLSLIKDSESHRELVRLLEGGTIVGMLNHGEIILKETLLQMGDELVTWINMHMTASVFAPETFDSISVAEFINMLHVHFDPTLQRLVESGEAETFEEVKLLFGQKRLEELDEPTGFHFIKDLEEFMDSVVERFPQEVSHFFKAEGFSEEFTFPAEYHAPSLNMYLNPEAALTNRQEHAPGVFMLVNNAARDIVGVEFTPMLENAFIKKYNLVASDELAIFNSKDVPYGSFANLNVEFVPTDDARGAANFLLVLVDRHAQADGERISDLCSPIEWMNDSLDLSINLFLKKASVSFEALN